MNAPLFGHKLKLLRKQSKLSQHELAERLVARFPTLRVSQTTISAWEQSDSIPHEQALEAVCAFFGESPDMFYEYGASRQKFARQYLEQLRRTQFERPQPSMREVTQQSGVKFMRDYDPDSEHLDY